MSADNVYWLATGLAGGAAIGSMAMSALYRRYHDALKRDLRRLRDSVDIRLGLSYSHDRRTSERMTGIEDDIARLQGDLHTIKQARLAEWKGGEAA